MKSPIEEEAIHASLVYYQALRRLANYRALAQYYRGMAHSFLRQLELHGEEPESRANIEDTEHLFAEAEADEAQAISSHEAVERLSDIKPLAEHDLPEDELARLLKALREDGFQWQPPRAV